MIKKENGFLSKLKDRIPVSRSEARRRAHKEMIKAARVQVTKGVMLGMTHALSQKHEPLEQPELLWWKAQSAKWETIWAMLNEASKDLEDFRQLSNLHKVAEVAFKLYEQMSVDAAVTLLEVPSEIVRSEATRWREAGTLIASLHRHCLLDKLNECQRVPSKNTGDSGITVMKEG